MNLNTILERVFVILISLTAINSVAQEEINTLTTAENNSIIEKYTGLQKPWLIVGGLAHHSCRTCGFRESNPGIAAQWQSPWFEAFTGLENTRLTAGAYINSNDRNSVYAGAQWLPWSYGPVKLGLQAVIITGYKEAAITPVLLPLISVETQHVGVDIYAVPKLAKVSSAVFATFKVRF